MLLANSIIGRTNFFHLCSRWLSESQNWRFSPSSNGTLTIFLVPTSQIKVNLSVSVVLTKTSLVFLGILYARVWCFPSSFSWKGFSIKRKSFLPVNPWNRKKKHIWNWMMKFQVGHFYEDLMNYRFLTTKIYLKALYIFLCLITTSSVTLHAIWSYKQFS